MTPSNFELYTGNGKTLRDRGLELPEVPRSNRLDAPEYYLAEKGLRDAVNVANALGQPLLVTGEPGTGKTQLAASIAYELNLPEPLVFQAKTTSAAKDLFYRYDSLRHFHDAQFRQVPVAIDEYITYDALGLAILLSLPPEAADPYLPERFLGKGPTRSVVLIDEIDKAPRDLPNDILTEIERAEFTVKEVGRTFSAGAGFRPVVVLTSNSEKNLPDAFLRRCVFYHIPFPDPQRLKEIVQLRVSFNGNFSPAALDHALSHFMEIRELALSKKPATAECLAWLQILDRMDVDVGKLQPGQAEVLAFTYCILAKNTEDLGRMRRALTAPQGT